MFPEKNKTEAAAAAGENFENLRFLIEFGALLQHSDNAVETFKVSRKKLELPAAGENFENLRFLVEVGALFRQFGKK